MALSPLALPWWIGLLRRPHGDSFHLGVHALALHAWWLASGTSGSRTSRKGLLTYCQGASESLPHPSPGREVNASVLGMAVRMLLQATPLTRSHGILSYARPGICPYLLLSVAALPLVLSRSEVPGPHVLLSNYVARVISRGPGILSSFSHLSWVVSLALQNLIWAPWSSYGHAKSVFFLVLKALFLLAPASAGSIGVFHAVSYCGSHSGGWSEVSFSFVPGFVAKTQDPFSLAPQFAGFTVPAQPSARQSQWETVISCAGGQVLPGLLCCASSAM